jgi:hypothetical protein
MGLLILMQMHFFKLRSFGGDAQDKPYPFYNIPINQ